ncbi:hypothetical protein Ddc_13810 [Ditylenchus destructor]|nr:hypothetical protein Ddc_13810 [Ditylenchus destructor]
MKLQSAKPNPKHIVFDLAVATAIGERRLDRSPAFIKNKYHGGRGSVQNVPPSPSPRNQCFVDCGGRRAYCCAAAAICFLSHKPLPNACSPNDKLLLGEWEAKSDGMNGENVQKIISIGDR